ncbi:response regulator transcription factor [Puniceicoccaceae bacterium K14]|nr:response regulator transcription factor [Puniceicoccaceae bacterium K14]
MKENIKIVVAEDETLFRDFLVRIIRQRFGFEIIGEVSTGEEAYELCKKHRPQLAFLDLRLPGISGQELAQRLIEEQPETRILIISAVEDPKRIGSLLSMGVAGFLNKKEEFSIFEQAIEAVANGQIFVKAAAQSNSETPDVLDQKELLATLSEREKQVVTFVASGMTNKEIAANLGLSIKTVESHRSNISKKLKIFDIAGVTLFAVRTGLVSL